MSDGQPNHDRLDSWKEIAAYIGRDKRTAIRWEKTRGLPIHRLPGGNAVFAYRHELDEWLRDGEIRQPATNSQDSETKTMPELPFQGTQYLAPRSSYRGSGKYAVAFSLCLLVVMGILAKAVFVRPPLHIHFVRITRLTDDGRYKRNLRTDGQSLYFNEIEGNREILAAASVAGGEVRQINVPFSNVDLQDLSSDGKYLLGLSYEGMDSERSVWYLPTGGGHPAQIGNLVCHLARISPDDRWLACAKGTTIMVTDRHGHHAHTVASFTSPTSDIAWTPDSRKLRISLQENPSNTHSAWELELSQEDIAPKRLPARLKLSEDCCLSFASINGGREFAYIKGGIDRDKGLFIKEQDQTIFKDEFESVLPVGIGALESVAPSQTPNMVYLLIEGAAHNEILKFNSEERGFNPTLPGLTADFISFSQDGKWMAYIDKEQQLWRSRSDGTDARWLSKGFKSAQLSAWSPDGNRLAFMGMKPGNPWRIYIVDRDGANIREASDGEDNQGAPTWSQDGKKIVYGDVLCAETQTCWIHVIDLDSGTTEKLAGSHDFRTARWSPDGKYIAARAPASDQLMLYDVKTHHWRVLADGVTGDTINWSFDGRILYADSPQKEKPVIESFRISDGKRTTVVSLTDLQKIPGQMEFWFGLAPDKSIILIHRSAASEIYSLEFTKN